mmetsp:Transcript_48602/g.67533  ORF Transcript_48602/g.67533 Transcript_48602/m.67533 type:complete len:83 (-) Transcript_48602:44-292(-)
MLEEIISGRFLADAGSSTELKVLVILLGCFSGVFCLGALMVCLSLCYKCSRRRMDTGPPGQDDRLVSLELTEVFDDVDTPEL